VKVTRADDEAAASAPAVRSGPVCSADRPTPGAANVDALLQQIQVEAIARARADSDGGGDRPIALNNRGYNYGPPPGVDPAAIRAELRRLPQ
jgi:hypothetical protein